jgi:hypothetical protein
VNREGSAAGAELRPVPKILRPHQFPARRHHSVAWDRRVSFRFCSVHGSEACVGTVTLLPHFRPCTYWMGPTVRPDRAFVPTGWDLQSGRAELLYLLDGTYSPAGLSSCTYCMGPTAWPDRALVPTAWDLQPGRTELLYLLGGTYSPAGPKPGNLAESVLNHFPQ